MIEGVRGSNGTGAVRRPTRGGAVFDIPGAMMPDEPSPVAAGSEIGGLPGLLALQEHDGDACADRRARRHGQGLLSALATLQRGLLHPDGPDPVALAALGALCGTLPFAADATLQGVLQAIALRARIELARHVTT